ncbi:MAG TPA: SDR family oxidoreductase [Terriglobales bacterium]|nr:SDR family oxidoreductase [Terriglobales bacterium]
MTSRNKTVLVVGATGSIGQLVVEEAIKQGHAVRALVRSASKARQLAREAESVVGDLTRPETLSAAVDGIDAIVFTHGSDGGGKAASEAVDYGGVRNILAALGSRTACIALMTSIGVTNRNSSYNRSTEAHDWKRRSERLVRASGLPYTIVRPGWFDYNGLDEHKLVLLQGDKRHSGTPKDGAILRQQLAEVLVRSFTSGQAHHKTFELVSAKGPAQDDFDTLFRNLEPDQPGALDGVQDMDNMPLEDEPQQVREDLDAVIASRSRLAS